MSTPSEGATRSFRISRVEELAPVRRWLKDQLERRQYSSHDTFAVRMGFEESVHNAITHGNNGDPAKRVTIDLAVSDEKADIIIEDEGPGFDYTHVKDPTTDENLFQAGGRGVMLIRVFLDEVHYNESGNRVHLVKYRSDSQRHLRSSASS